LPDCSVYVKPIWKVEQPHNQDSFAGASASMVLLQMTQGAPGGKKKDPTTCRASLNASKAMQQQLWPVLADDGQCHPAWAHLASTSKLLAAYSDGSCLHSSQGRKVKPTVI